MNGLYPLLGIRAYIAEVRSRLAALPYPPAIADSDIIAAWLDFQPADEFISRFETHSGQRELCAAYSAHLTRQLAAKRRGEAAAR